MKRRLQGMCLILLGAGLGWLSGGELAVLARARGRVAAADWLWVGGKLLLGLGVIFVGVAFLVGLPARRTDDAEDGRP